jgi:hypothetical protein
VTSGEKTVTFAAPFRTNIEQGLGLSFNEKRAADGKRTSIYYATMVAWPEGQMPAEGLKMRFLCLAFQLEPGTTAFEASKLELVSISSAPMVMTSKDSQSDKQSSYEFRLVHATRPGEGILMASVPGADEDFIRKTMTFFWNHLH